MIFEDESGFLLTPNVTRSWAPRGQTPLLHHVFKHDRLAALRALVVSPKRTQIHLETRLFTRSITGLDIRSFLKDLRRRYPRGAVLLWDRGPIHKRYEVKLWMSEHPELTVEPFPAYAPELNPVEKVWAQIDQALYNIAPKDLTQLKRMVRREIKRLERSPKLLWACIYGSKLPWKR